MLTDQSYRHTKVVSKRLSAEETENGPSKKPDPKPDPKPEAKTEDKTKQQPKKTEQSAQETSAVASVAAATGSGIGTSEVCDNPDQSGKICVYDLKDQKSKTYEFNKQTANIRKNSIKSIVYEYNNVAMQPNYILPVSDKVSITFSDPNYKGDRAIFRKTLEQEASIKAVVSGYTTLCARNIGKNGVTATDFPATIGYGRICVATACNETTHTYDKNKKICVSKPGSSKQSAQIQPEPVQEPQPTQEWEPTFAEAKLGNHINVPSEHIKEQVVIKWLDDANAAIAAAGGTNEVEETTDSNGETVYTCIILRCKDPKKVPNSNGTACIDASEKLDAQSATLNPGEVKAGDVEISANTPTLTKEEMENNQNRSRCEDYKDGDWDENQKKCLCANGNEIALNGDAVCQDEEEKPVAEEPVSEDPVVEPVAEEPVIAEQETPCDDQNEDVEHIITEMVQPKTDEDGRIYIEYSIKYETCDNLQTKWAEKCPADTESSVEKNADKIKLTCIPKETNNDDNNSNVQAIIDAFKNKANELKEKECATQTEQA